MTCLSTKQKRVGGKFRKKNCKAPAKPTFIASYFKLLVANYLIFRQRCVAEQNAKERFALEFRNSTIPQVLSSTFGTPCTCHQKHERALDTICFCCWTSQKRRSVVRLSSRSWEKKTPNATRIALSEFQSLHSIPAPTLYFSRIVSCWPVDTLFSGDSDLETRDMS